MCVLLYAFALCKSIAQQCTSQHCSDSIFHKTFHFISSVVLPKCGVDPVKTGLNCWCIVQPRLKTRRSVQGASCGVHFFPSFGRACRIVTTATTRARISQTRFSTSTIIAGACLAELRSSRTMEEDSTRRLPLFHRLCQIGTVQGSWTRAVLLEHKVILLGGVEDYSSSMSNDCGECGNAKERALACGPGSARASNALAKWVSGATRALTKEDQYLRENVADKPQCKWETEV